MKSINFLSKIRSEVKEKYKFKTHDRVLDLSNSNLIKFDQKKAGQGCKLSS